MRAPGKRCQGRYCFSSLKRFYDQDPETIVKSNRMMINPAEHCSPSETKYAWKCPRCRGKCVCSTCRKAAGLEPLGKWTGSPKQSKVAAAGVDDKKPTKGKAKARGDSAVDEIEPAKSSVKAGSKGTGRDRNIAEAVAAAQRKGSKAKTGKTNADTSIEVVPNEDDGITTPPPPGGKPPPKRTLASILSSTGVRAPTSKALKPPTEAPPPALEVIQTKLPQDNLRARMWIYESMVRFDKFGLNRTVLSQLDRFEVWTHSMAQDMLACLLKTIAGLSNIEKGQPTKPYVKAISAYRAHGKSLQRGEPWSAAIDLLGSLGLSRIPLPFVEHDIPVEVEAAAAQRSPSPPAVRVTRARKAKETNQYEIARQLSMFDRWGEDESSETGSDAYDDDDDKDARPSGRRQAPPAKKSIYVYDDPSDDDSMIDPDESARARRSARARKPSQKEPAPEIRLTGRQQAIKLQQEQQREEEAAHQRKEEDAAREAEATRKRRPPDVHDDTASDTTDDKDGDHQSLANGRSHKRRRQLTAGHSADEAESDGEGEHSIMSAKSNGATTEKSEADVHTDQREEESPDLETKVSIISALIDAAVMADSVAEELKVAAESIAAMERTHKAINADMEKEIAEELAELNKRAPSIVSPEYQKWKATKATLEHDIAWRRQDARVTSELAIDTHALRTGPIGHDADGREYWHLREYQERMPKLTEGRYAWCLVVLGKAFPVNSNQLQKETEDGQRDASMTDAAEEGRTASKDDDSALTSLDSTSDEEMTRTEAGDVKLGLPTSLKNGTHDTDHENGSTRICMGTNDPATIKTLTDYITYRLDRIEYEENVTMQEREKQARLAKDGEEVKSQSPAADGASTDKVETEESMYSIRKAKQTLKESQEERRKQVEQLVKRLHKSKEYFAWHHEELAP